MFATQPQRLSNQASPVIVLEQVVQRSTAARWTRSVTSMEISFAYGAVRVDKGAW